MIPKLIVKKVHWPEPDEALIAARDTKVELHDHRPGLTGSKHMAGHFRLVSYGQSFVIKSQTKFTRF